MAEAQPGPSPAPPAQNDLTVCLSLLTPVCQDDMNESKSTRPILSPRKKEKGTQFEKLFNTTDVGAFGMVNEQLQSLSSRLKENPKTDVSITIKNFIAERDLINKNSLLRVTRMSDLQKIGMHRGLVRGIHHRFLAHCFDIDDHTVIGYLRTGIANYPGVYQIQDIEYRRSYDATYFEKLLWMLMNTVEVTDVSIFCDNNPEFGPAALQQHKDTRQKRTKKSIREELNVPDTTFDGHIKSKNQEGCLQSVYEKLIKKKKSEQKNLELEMKKLNLRETQKTASGKKYTETTTHMSQTEKASILQDRHNVKPLVARGKRAIRKLITLVKGSPLHYLTEEETEILKASIESALPLGLSFARLSENNNCTDYAVRKLYKLMRESGDISELDHRNFKRLQLKETVKFRAGQLRSKSFLFSLYEAIRPADGTAVFTFRQKSPLEQIFGSRAAAMFQSMDLSETAKLNTVKIKSQFAPGIPAPFNLLELMIKIISVHRGWKEEKMNENLRKLLVGEYRVSGTKFNPNKDLCETRVIDEIKKIYMKTFHSEYETTASVYYSKSTRKFVISTCDGKGNLFRSLCTDPSCWSLGQMSHYQNSYCATHAPNFRGHVFVVRDVKNPKYSAFVINSFTYTSKELPKKYYLDAAIVNLKKTTEFEAYLEEYPNCELKLLYGPLISGSHEEKLGHQNTLSFLIVSHGVLRNGTDVNLTAVDHPLIYPNAINEKYVRKQLFIDIMKDTGHNLQMLSLDEYMARFGSSKENAKELGQSFTDMWISSGLDRHSSHPSHPRISTLCLSPSCPGWTKEVGEDEQGTRILIYTVHQEDNSAYVGVKTSLGKNRIMAPGSGYFILAAKNPQNLMTSLKVVAIMDNTERLQLAQKQPKGLSGEQVDLVLNKLGEICEKSHSHSPNSDAPVKILNTTYLNVSLDEDLMFSWQSLGMLEFGIFTLYYYDEDEKKTGNILFDDYEAKKLSEVDLIDNYLNSKTSRFPVHEFTQHAQDINAYLKEQGDNYDDDDDETFYASCADQVDDDNFFDK